MSAIPQPTHGTAQIIYGLHARRAAAEPARDYLGWSTMGEPCDRALWYSFRWAERELLEGRIARLFDSGHREEARVLQEMRDAGMQVWDRDPTTGGQWAVSSVAGHLRGHLDAVVLGMPEAPKTPHLVDVKTVKGKKLDELLKVGMRELYPRYWAQAHGYMGRMQLARAAFIFVCKDDDRIHVERFEFDRAEFERFEVRAERIVRAAEPPPRISVDPAWYVCKYCTFHSLCHGQAAPQVNCRTCTHATPVMEGDEGKWHCDKYAARIPTATQREGCDSHRFIPLLLERIGTAVDVKGEADVVYEAAGGGRFTNGEAPTHFTSHEIRACQDKRFLAASRDMADVQALRRDFGARVVG